jgi:hypothetical protein
MKKRTGGRVTINWTCSVHAKPFVNAASMETVCTIRNASDYVLDVVLWEVYWATSDSSIPSSVLEVLLVMAGSVDTVLPRLNLFKAPNTNCTHHSYSYNRKYDDFIPMFWMTWKWESSEYWGLSNCE